MVEGYRESAAEDRSLLVVAFAGQIFGIEASDGSIRWEHRVDYGAEVEVLVRHGRVYATMMGKELHCLDYATGRLLGKVPIPDTYKGRPTMVIERDRIYVGSQGEVSCFTIDGHHLWTQGFAGKGTGNVALGFPGNVRQADDAQ
ncbi:MAG TPA: PQQ-binding-like beta-propeller repeat protein [Sandaracinaceae bacterium LLY-WYZ-13_1]|nr:PQQ-binding-like beta-propeller repeat protein [Sandaracinaceae bacterium LLY-WYZ-13_1]